MDFIVDYSDQKPTITESTNNNIESVISPTESIIMAHALPTEIMNKPKKRKTKKQLEALEKARLKASQKIKENHQKLKQLKEDEEKEKNDVEYVQEKYNYYKEKLKSFNKEVEQRNTQYKNTEETIRTLNEDDLLILRMLEKY